MEVQPIMGAIDLPISLFLFQEVVREMVGRSGTLDVLKLKVITLSQGKGSTVINTAMANQELAQLRKRWEALSKDTQKR